MQKVFFETSSPALRPTQTANQLVSRFFPVGNVAGAEVNYSPSFNVKVKNEWKYTSAPPVCLHGVDKGNSTFVWYI
jgi:hypothetical protein